MPSPLHTKKPRAKCGLPRPCKACGQAFTPKNNKGRFCSESCKKAQARRKAQEPQIGTAATTVARVPFRSKSLNNINGVSGHFLKPRVAAKTGWHVEHGQLVFYPMPGTAALTPRECRQLVHGHMLVAGHLMGETVKVDVNPADLGFDIPASLTARSAVPA